MNTEQVHGTRAAFPASNTSRGERSFKEKGEIFTFITPP